MTEQLVLLPFCAVLFITIIIFLKSLSGNETDDVEEEVVEEEKTERDNVSPLELLDYVMEKLGRK